MFWLLFYFILWMFQLLWIIFREYQSPARTVAWIGITILVPILGFILYLWIASPYPKCRTSPRIQPHHAHVEISLLRIPRRIAKFLEQLPTSSVSSQNLIQQFTYSQDCFEAMLEAIRDAKQHIHFQFYTIRYDRIGRKFKEVLLEKARQGVAVRVIYDGIGSYRISNAYLKELIEAGVEIYEFMPQGIQAVLQKINYRNHRKVIVLDGKIGFMGGMNIGDEYLGDDPNLGFWRDTHLKLTGPAVHQLQSIFLQDWQVVTGQLLQDALFYPPIAGGQSAVQIIESGPDMQESNIFELVFTAVTSAEKSVYISTPYFIPNPSIRSALQLSARCGLDVRLILPEKVDSQFTRYATLSFVEELLACGVKVYLYQKGFMHGKVMIIDHCYATVGSANMDWRSFYDNFEVAAVLYDASDVKTLENSFFNDLKQCVELDLHHFQKRRFAQKGKERIARIFGTFL